MKLRDSGMPEEAYWESLFDVPLVLERLGIDCAVQDLAELGCGYGTFTIPIARTIRGRVYTFDIEPEMIDRTRQRAEQAGLANVVAKHLDVMERGFDVPARVDVTLLFNILHCHEPERLIRHAVAATKPGGRVLVIHWRHDPATPRGPSLDIRPKPERIAEWSTGCGLAQIGEACELPPWHFGLEFRPPQS